MDAQGPLITPTPSLYFLLLFPLLTRLFPSTGGVKPPEPNMKRELTKPIKNQDESFDEKYEFPPAKRGRRREFNHKYDAFERRRTNEREIDEI